MPSYWRALLRRFLIPAILLTGLSGLHPDVQTRDPVRLFQVSYANTNTTLDTDSLFHHHIQLVSQGVLETLGNLTSTIVWSDFTLWIACHLARITLLLSLQSVVGTGNRLGILHSVVSKGAPLLIDLALILVVRKRVLARFLPVVTGNQAK